MLWTWVVVVSKYCLFFFFISVANLPKLCYRFNVQYILDQTKSQIFIKNWTKSNPYFVSHWIGHSSEAIDQRVAEKARTLQKQLKFSFLWRKGVPWCCWGMRNGWVLPNLMGRRSVMASLTMWIFCVTCNKKMLS